MERRSFVEDLRVITGCQNTICKKAEKCFQGRLYQQQEQYPVGDGRGTTFVDQEQRDATLNNIADAAERSNCPNVT